MRSLRFLQASMLIACVSLVGCIQAREDKVPGEYHAKAEWGDATLVLSPDHSLHETVRLNIGQRKSIDGHWKLDGPTHNSINTDITLIPYLNVTHDKQGADAPAAFLSIERGLLGGMSIAADPDWSIEWRKQ